MKSLAEFAVYGEKVTFVFSTDMCGRKNTSQLASVRAQRSAPAGAMHVSNRPKGGS